MCNETLSTITECAQKGCEKVKKNGGCAGFITKLNSQNCELCYPGSYIQITSGSYTQVNTGDVIYLIKRNEKPDVYLPLEPENITGTTIVADGVSGILNKEDRHFMSSVVDPGFPVGGRGPIRGAWTSDEGAFWQKCMQKRKNWVPWGGVRPARPLDPPMVLVEYRQL